MAKLNITNRNKNQFDKDGKPKPANWQYRFEAARVNGKRNMISKAGFKTKKEAEIAGIAAAEYAKNGGTKHDAIECTCGDNVGYVLPQKIDKNSEKVKLFFRVRNVFKNCTVKVTCGDKVILSKKKRIVLPGEMETLILDKDVIDGLNGDIVVSLEV